MSFFTKKNRGKGKKQGSFSSSAPFSIDDAFDIPEDEEIPSTPRYHAHTATIQLMPDDDEEDLDDDTRGQGHRMEAPIIKNGQLRGAKDDDRRNNLQAEGATDSASLIQSDTVNSGGQGYYDGPQPLKYWWHHPKIKNNYKLVLAAFCLVFLGIALMIGGIVVYCMPNLEGIQGLVFLIAGVICFLPGAYHVGYIYLAVKGKRGFEFNHLPLFNN